MLKAMLHHKLGRPEDDPETPSSSSASPSPSAWDSLTTREDPLTSAVFERFAYLEPLDAWALLRAACLESGQAEMPDSPPPGRPVWWFWPRLSPGPEGFNSRHVEPDVLVDWGELLLIIEAKQAGAQHASQWIEQIRAVRSDPRFAGKRLLFIAAGGADSGTFATIATAVARELDGDKIGFVLLRWATLRQVAEALCPRLPPTSAAVVGDILLALGAWGYERRIGFDSFAVVASKLHITTTLASLNDWRIR